MEPEWLTYAEVADRLGVTPEAARSRAKCSGWRRQSGNDGRALVLVALESRPPDDRPVAARSATGYKADNAAVVKALEAHVQILLSQLASADRLAPADTRLAAADARDAQHAVDLAAERAQTAKAIAAFVALAERLDVLAAERARPWWKRRLAGG
jgi:hypothetical protein